MEQLKERPILFNGDMVRAILEGRKTQTRRAFSDRTKFAFDCAARIGEVSFFLEQDELGKNDLGYVLDFCPYGKVGDRLWVRETFSAMGNNQGHATPIFYRADSDDGMPWTPSIHMPRWASRINLEITAVRVERLQDISEADARAEGCTKPRLPVEISGVAGDYIADERTSFAVLWNRINSAGSWQQNPWVWVVEFKKL